MNQLPHESTASATKGIWFVFTDGDDIIRASGSCWTGLDHVYFNDQLVVQAIKRHNHYAFHRNGHNYQVHLCTRSLMHGHLRCTLNKDGKRIGAFSSRRRKFINTRPALTHISVGVLLGLTAGLLPTPGWFGWIFIFASLAITIMSSIKTDQFIVESI